MANATLTYSLDTPSAGVATITGRSSSGAEDLVIPATIGGQNVVAIAESAFHNQILLTSLDLSGATNLLTIGFGAFRGCSGFFGNLVIPNSVTSIGDDAFLDIVPSNIITGNPNVPALVATGIFISKGWIKYNNVIVSGNGSTPLSGLLVVEGSDIIGSGLL